MFYTCGKLLNLLGCMTSIENKGDNLLYTKLILGLRSLRRIAAHTPVTIRVLGLGTLVFVAASRMLCKTGANVDSSACSLPQLNVFRSSLHVLHRKESTLFEAISLTSLQISFPTRLRTYFLVEESFIHSTATDFLLPRLTAFPKCFRWGVRTYVFGFLYPTCT